MLLYPAWMNFQKKMPTGNPPMKTLIEAINKLQEVFSNAGLPLDKFHLPQIAVVGGQSAGKSSVLENFVGRDFLPRGSDIVTRCPLVVQLIHNKKEYGKFDHKAQEFESFEDIRNEIEERTNFLTGGKNKGISNKAILLTIYSPQVVDLTLVDLPGLTKVPVGDQPQDIGDQIKKLALKYISNENTLILAISPANNDIANSDALQLAKEVDPERKRTFGVITKLDIMDEGTDAKNILNNLVYRLDRGFVGIVNRSQKDIENKKDITEAQKAEMKFFKKHPAYSDIANRMGSKYLQEMLSRSLEEHILKKFPDLKKSLKKLKEETETELNSFIDYDGSSQMAGNIVHRLCKNFGTIADQLINGYSLGLSKKELTTGAKIIQVFSFNFPEILIKNKNAFNEEELQYTLLNNRGVRFGLFASEVALENCLKTLVKTYVKPSFECVEEIAVLLREMVAGLCKDMKSFPKLEEKVKELCNEKLLEFESEAKVHIKDCIQSEGSLMDTKDPGFRPIGSVEDIPLLYYKEIEKYFKEENPTTMVPTFFPTLNLNAGKKNKIIKECSVIIKQDGFSLGRYLLLLSAKYLDFYIAQRELQTFLGKIKISTVKIEYSELTELDLSIEEKPFPTGSKRIVLMFGSRSERDSWRGNIVKILDKPNITNPEELPKPAKKMRIDKGLQEQMEMTAYLVDTYMKIVHKTIASLIPKRIKHLLVDKLMHYIHEDLIINLQVDPQKLLDVNPEELKRKAELNEVYKATEKSLDTLNTMSREFKLLR